MAVVVQLQPSVHIVAHWRVPGCSPSVVQKLVCSGRNSGVAGIGRSLQISAKPDSSEALLKSLSCRVEFESVSFDPKASDDSRGVSFASAKFKVTEKVCEHLCKCKVSLF
jgi:hypothetical protein